MFPLPHVAKKKIAVFGLGLTGLATCKALVASGAEVFCWDESAATCAKTKNTKYASSHPKEWPWAELSSLVVSPGVPLTHPHPHVIVRKAQLEGVEVIGDIELFARTLNSLDAPARPRVIGVTGTNGKSTTTALIGHILRESGRRVHVGGNIGEPLLSLAPPSDGAIYVLELSSYQLDLAHSFRPSSGIVLNFAPDHLERHGTMANYIAAKARMFAHGKNDDLAIIGIDDPDAQSLCAELVASGRRVTPISSGGALGRGIFALDSRLYYRLGQKTGEAGSIGGIETLRGAHNAQNAAAALAAVMEEEVSPAVAIRSMERFKGLAHRAEIVAREDGVDFINDSKATNVAAAANALENFDNIYWIAGGRAKDEPLTALRYAITGVERAYFIGEAAETFQTSFGGFVPSRRFDGLEQAVTAATEDAFKAGGGVVLLSPACASHDQFRNFEDRGDTFRLIVSDLLSERSEARSAETEDEPPGKKSDADIDQGAAA